MGEQPLETAEADDVYRQLQQHLDDYPVPFPSMKTGSDISLLKYLFTPDEAKIASVLKFGVGEYESLDAIFERAEFLGYSKAELEQMLDEMGKKGSIWAYSDNDGTKRYAGAPLVVGMFEMQIHKLTSEFIEKFQTYATDGWFQAYAGVGVPQLRVVPVGISVEHKTAISTYDDIKAIIEAAEGPFCVQDCVCRQYYDIQGEHCKNTQRREVCMGWGPLANMYLQEGWGRQITREEALDILRENEREGMILQPSNAQQPDFVCSCCTCCDLALRMLKSTNSPAAFVTTNYFSQSDPDVCTGCGECVDRCQMAAITLQDEKAVVDKLRCIGCGNCAAICPSEAMTLQKKAVETVPPVTMEDLFNKMQQSRTKLKESERRRQARLAKRQSQSEISDKG